MTTYINIPVPEDKVDAVYRLLAGFPHGGGGATVTRIPLDLPASTREPVEKPVDGPRAPRRCGATTTVDGVKVRCHKGPRHQGRHQWQNGEGEYEEVASS
jgi:hypothetical protein